MSATCGLDELHGPHVDFYGWPRQERVCDGLPTAKLEDLARDLILRARVDLLDDLGEYLRGQAGEMGSRTTGEDGRWAVGYLAALGDVANRVARLRRGETGGR